MTPPPKEMNDIYKVISHYLIEQGYANYISSGIHIYKPRHHHSYGDSLYLSIIDHTISISNTLTGYLITNIDLNRPDSLPQLINVLKQEGLEHRPPKDGAEPP